MKSRILLFLCAFVTTSQLVNAQDIMVDRNGDDVLLYYEANKAQFTISSGDPALKINYTKPLKSFFYYIDTNANDTFNIEIDRKTISKSHGLSFTGKLTSTDDYLFLSNLNELKPAVELKLGYQNTVDMINNLDALPSNTFGRVWGIELAAKMDNTSLYDSIGKTVSDHKPLTITIKAHFSAVRFRWILPSISGELANTWNKNDLTKFQKNKPTYVDPNVIALDDFSGYIGVSERLWTARIRISTPLFIPSDNRVVSRLSLTPYYVSKISTTNSNLVGVSLNYFSKQIGGPDYNYSEAFGIGFDWEKKGSLPTTSKIFIYGTLNIGEVANWIGRPHI